MGIIHIIFYWCNTFNISIRRENPSEIMKRGVFNCLRKNNKPSIYESCSNVGDCVTAC